MPSKGHFRRRSPKDGGATSKKGGSRLPSPRLRRVCEKEEAACLRQGYGGSARSVATLQWACVERTQLGRKSFRLPAVRPPRLRAEEEPRSDQTKLLTAPLAASHRPPTPRQLCMGKHRRPPRPYPSSKRRNSDQIHKNHILYDFEMSDRAELIRGATLVGSGQGGGQGPCAYIRARTRILEILNV